MSGTASIGSWTKLQAPTPAAELYWLRLEEIVRRQEDHVPLAQALESADLDRHRHGARAHLHLGRHEEAGPPGPIGIREHRAREERLRIHRADRREVRERASHGRRAVAGVDPNGLPHAQAPEVAAIHVEVDPDGPEA